MYACVVFVGYVESDFWDTMFTGAEEFGKQIKPSSGLKVSKVNRTKFVNFL